MDRHMSSLSCILQTPAPLLGRQHPAATWAEATQPGTTLTSCCLTCRACARARTRSACLPGACAGPCYRACAGDGPHSVCLPGACSGPCYRAGAGDGPRGVCLPCSCAGPCCRACTSRHPWGSAPAGSWRRARPGPAANSRGRPSLSPGGGSRGGGRGCIWGSSQPWAQPPHNRLSYQAGYHR